MPSVIPIDRCPARNDNNTLAFITDERLAPRSFANYVAILPDQGSSRSARSTFSSSLVPDLAPTVNTAGAAVAVDLVEVGPGSSSWA
jgi:hypothetical protein